ncbi:IS66 family insertion sequence element accessory protein TnpA [Lentibacillus salicampi]|uniref:IS66 family insertion sequence element accessory protein TnpB n=1 Tax=Lentibacillus salicampi TaxID=175306 RepID=A0A4Y9A8A7_9BACI|nr:transposase [Lentibacillus salicampi]TFJ91715.1 IS66 family insertion sequence element accessory protein TnpB [Lentibacillus salicampi]
MTLKDKRIAWKSRYDAWKESDQGVAEWCRDHDIKPHQMYYWIQQFQGIQDAQKEEPGGTQWLTVQMDNDFVSSEGQVPIYIHFDAISVEVRPGANAGLLSDVVHILRNQC